MRVWIDTDVGSDVDDALAIAYVLRHPALELAGISTVFGDVALRTRIARHLLALAGDTAIPVVTGLGVPSSPARVGRMFGHEGAGLFEDAAPRMEVTEEPDAAEKGDRLAAAIEEANADALLAIGPLTNLAALVRRGVSLPPITMMGGHVDRARVSPGMIESIPEWNWWCDPEAVRVVLGAEHAVPPRIVPAEVTFQTRLVPADLARFATGDPLDRALGVLCEAWLVVQRERLGATEPLVRLHDPLAAATLVETGLTAFAQRSIRVDERGATETVPDGAPVDVAIDVDNDALRAHLATVWHP